MTRLSLLLDFSIQPYSIGDLLMALAGARATADERSLSGVDVVILADPRKPHEDPNMEQHHQASWASLSKLIPLLELAWNPSRVSIHTQEARLPAERWPDIGKYITYDGFKAVHAYWKRHGESPRLCFSEKRCAWADAFLSRWARPITVNLRKNTFHLQRNYDPSTWATFLDCAALSHGVTFVVVGEVEEISPELRGKPHVVFAKDHGTTLLQDLSLIHRSPGHIGSSSGPMTVAILGDTPYVVPDSDIFPHLALYDGAIVPHPGTLDFHYVFAKPGQRCSGTKASLPWLFNAMEELVAAARWAK